MTRGQREALAALTDGPKTARELGAIVFPDIYRHADKARKRLRTAEDNGLVRRTYLASSNGARWELTEAGRAALEPTT